MLKSFKPFGPRPKGRRLLAVGALLLAAALGGCSISLSDIGSGDEDGQPKDANGFPMVNAPQGARNDLPLEPAERSRIQNELIAARDAQAAAAAAAAAAAK